MSRLAVLGGKPLRTEPYPDYNTIGEEEKRLALEVLDSGILSDFMATSGPHFLGGKMVRRFEEVFCEYFGAKYAVSFNSATSGLHAAVAAAGVGPGDEVVVTACSMSATATAIVMQSGIPIFGDIEADIYNLDPVDTAAKITPQTKAIMVANLIGHPASLGPLRELADLHKLILIEDNAQSPGAQYHGRWAGTIGHMGVFSLNCYKTIQCGEGGMVVTDDEGLATRLRLVRNHGETTVEHFGLERDFPVVGWNYRMTELQAAVAIAQFGKLDQLNAQRIALADYLSKKLQEIPGLEPVTVRPGNTHVYYVYPFSYDAAVLGLPRNVFINALKAEGFPVIADWGRPMYEWPMFRHKLAFGKQGWPFSAAKDPSRLNYYRGACPRTEEFAYQTGIITTLCRPPLGYQEIDQFMDGMYKVLEHRQELLPHAEELMDAEITYSRGRY